MLFLSIPDPSILLRPLPPVDGVELRLDLFPSINLPFLQKFIYQSPLKIMLTLGKIPLTEEILSLAPDFIDIDFTIASASPLYSNNLNTPIQWILSHHDFSQMPDLQNVYKTMKELPAFGYKIAGTCRSSLDALNLLGFVKKHPKMIGICMGEKGSFGRILGPIVGNLIHYGAYDETTKTAPGQYTVKELLQTYHFSSLNQKTSVYALLGSPIHLSQGHIYHNAVFQTKKENSVYVKIDLLAEELSLALKMMQDLNFKGLSVTMPLKEAILPFLDEIDSTAQKIGAVNTVSIKQGMLVGTNTDYLGALQALEKRGDLKGKTAVVLGAGGAAKAIVYGLLQKGAQVWVINRTESRAKQLATSLDCHVGMPNKYDILIHCGMAIEEKDILPEVLAMDVVHTPKDTPFLQLAQKKNCDLIYGEEMFVLQARAQTAFWFPSIKTQIFTGKNILYTDLFRNVCSSFGKKIIVISDPYVEKLYGEKFAQFLGAISITIPAKEEAKTQLIVDFLIEKLAEMECDKDTLLIGVGGGSTTDCVGFVASIYKRGVSLIFIPTTVLGMVDASIGGKTAINTRFGKNLIGTFYPANAIFADFTTLATLSPKQWQEGMAEIVKLALVFDKKIWDLFLQNPQNPSLLTLAMQGKAKIVEQDPFDGSIRKILNFGHTIGHALESLSNYRLSHGEAVAFGSLIEAHLSYQLKFLSLEDFNKIEKAYSFFPLQLPSLYKREAFLTALFQDKKKQEGSLHFVVIEQIGKAASFQGAYTKEVSLEELSPTLLWMETLYG